MATHTITASYSGNATYAASSGTASEEIDPVGSGATTTTLGAASPSSPVFGQSVTLTATVSPSTGSGTPTGSVTFYDGSISLGTGTLTAGVATVSTTALAQGTDTITATYNGDPTYADSTSTGQSVTVAQDATTTAVTPSANPAAVGSIVFTATVGANSPGSGTPTGTVEFLENGASMGTGTLDASGQATFTTSTLTQGSYSITADYLGDTNFATSNSSTLTEVVQAIGTTSSATVVFITPNPPGIADQPLTFSAEVYDSSGGGGTPTGTVTFLNGTTTLGTATLDANMGNLASFTLSSGLPLGTYTIYADYSGDATYAASSDNISEPIVAATSTSTTVNASDDPAVTGELVSFTATVSANAQDAGTPTGTVNFLDGTTTMGTGTLDANGVATFSTSALTVANSPYTIVANYLGDSTFTASSSATLSPLSETIEQAATSAQISSSADPAVFGQPVTFTAYVASDSPGAGTPTGTVTFDDNGVSIGSGTLDANGTASFTTTTNLTAGVHSITATYGGDTNYSTSALVTLSETVQTGTTTSLTATTGPVVYGQSVTLSATVSPASGSTTPTGTVTFLDGSTTLGTGTLTAGVATLTTTALPEGADTITASYAGTTLFAASTSTGASETVNQDPTTTALASSANPAVAGQYVTFTATVSPSSPGSGTPTGTVTFLDGGASVGTGTLDSSGVAAFSTTALPLGSDSITASYAGDTNYAGSSTDTALSETVNAIGSTATTTAVTTSASTANAGDSVTFSATVSHATGSDVLSGTVTFLDGATVLGTGAVDTTSGIATFSTSTLPVGSSETITASYSGDANYAGSNGTTFETIDALATTTTLSASDNAPIFTESVTFTATVGHTAGSATPTGTVTFLDGSTTLGTGTLNASGLATFSTAALPLGSDNITASYSGDASYSTSTTAGPAIIVVKQETSLTTLAASANPAVSGQYVTFTATVTVATPGTGTPIGTVNFLDGTTTLGTGTLTAGGLATFTTSALTQGVHTVTAVYQGDTDFATSTSDALTEGINQVGATVTTTVLAAAPTSQTVGQSVTFTATVTTATGTPTGSVTFLEGTTVLDTVTLGSNGKAIFSTSALPIGSAQTIDAIYSGDTSFASSQGTATETITGSTNSPFSPAATDAALGQDTNWLD